MVINGQWQGPPGPAHPVPDHYRPPASQRSMPVLRHLDDAPRQPSSALRPRAPSSPARQFFPAFPPRTTSANTRHGDGPPPATRNQMSVAPPPRNASLAQPNNFYPPPRISSAAAEQPLGGALPPRKSSKPAEVPFAIAGTTPPPHLPLRLQASQNLRMGRSTSQKRPPNIWIRQEPLSSDPNQRPRPRSAEISPSSSPALTPRNDIFPPPTTTPSTASFLEPPSSSFGPPPRSAGLPNGYTSNSSSQISLASAPAARPPPAHQGYAVGNAFRSTSTPQPLGDIHTRQQHTPAPEAKSPQMSRKHTGPWQDQVGASSLRESVRSALTTSSSAIDHSGTDRSSIVTSRSSSSDVNQQGTNWPKIREENADGEEVISVDEYLDMYADGFDTSPAVTATDGDFPAVPPLPLLQKDVGFPFPTLPPEQIEGLSSEQYSEAEQLPPLIIENTPDDRDSSPVEQTIPKGLPGPEPGLDIGKLDHSQANRAHSQNNMLSVASPLPTMRRVESLMPEPPLEDPPTPEPPQDDHPEPKPSYFDTSRAVSPASVVRQSASIQSNQRPSSIQSASAQTASSLDSERVFNEERGLGMLRSHSSNLSLGSASARPLSTESDLTHPVPLQSDSSQPEPVQEEPLNLEAPRLSSYTVESPYSQESSVHLVNHADAHYDSSAPPNLLPRPESSYDEPSMLRSTTPGLYEEARPVTAPAPPSSPPQEPTLPEIAVPGRPQTAPRLQSIDEQHPMPPPEQHSTHSSPVHSPMQSPTSARFPSGSQASSLGSPVLSKHQLHGGMFRPGSQASFASSSPFKARQPERGSFRPAPRARMMAPPMKVGAIGPGGVPRSFASGPRTSAQIMAGIFDASDLAASGEEEPQSPHRDRYGFKKQSQYVQEEQYDAWNLYYAVYLERRRNKWNELMISSGCSIDKPTVFPAKSDKIKRYIRKGIPPEWRGAAWFYYAGGPERVSKNPQLYVGLATRGDRGDMSEQDREHIERDLHRTFPDNVKFKADPEPEAEKRSTMMSSRLPNNRTTISSSSTGSRDSTHEQPMIRSLRRVLRAFAIHCPKIGYCQSLNFLAGQLLLFLDGDEEKAFHLLCVLTTEHLPGTHGFALEGANVDIGVLMQSLRDSMPAVWAKLDDRAGSTAKTGLGDMRTQTGLPTVSLATTAWFMSCFVGTLPVESACRVWDCLFYEGSKTLFRVALGIFRLGEPEIRRLSDPMEIFQVVQTLPRHLIDANALMEASFGKGLERRGLLSQGVVERRRIERRNVYNAETIANLQPTRDAGNGAGEFEKEKRGLSRGIGTLKRLKSRKGRT